MDAANRQLLCFFAALDDQRDLPDVAADWDALLAALDEITRSNRLRGR